MDVHVDIMKTSGKHYYADACTLQGNLTLEIITLSHFKRYSGDKNE